MSDAERQDNGIGTLGRMWSEAGDGMWTVPARSSRSGRPAQGRGIRFPAQSDGHGLGRRSASEPSITSKPRHGRNVVLRTLTPSREMQPALGLRFVEGRRAERTRCSTISASGF